MSLLRTAWVKLNRLQTGVGRFHSYMLKWSLSPSPKYECGAVEQTADHVLIACPIRWASHGARALTAWIIKPDAGLTPSQPISDPGSTATWGSKRINP